MRDLKPNTHYEVRFVRRLDGSEIRIDGPDLGPVLTDLEGLVITATGSCSPRDVVIKQIIRLVRRKAVSGPCSKCGEEPFVRQGSETFEMSYCQDYNCLEFKCSRCGFIWTKPCADMEEAT